MTLIIGLNAYHGDSSACVVRDGELIAAAEEERFRRVKHWAGFPSEAFQYCLREAGASLLDVDIVALNSDPRSNVFRKAAYVLRQRPDLRLVADRLRNQKKRLSVDEQIAAAFPGQTFRGKIQRVEHHLAHLASAFLVSPFEEASLASIDGFGDFASVAWGFGHGIQIDVEDRIHFPHSLGVFYQAMTQFLGFPHYGDEYKVMGLAPYGRPEHLSQLRQIVRLKEHGRFELNLRYFRHNRKKVDYAWEGGSPHVGTLYSRELEDLLGPARAKDEPLGQRHRDLAHSVQAAYEEAFFHLINHLYETHRVTGLALAGGCAMNSVANGKVKRRSHFTRLYVQAAAGDAGGAIGAAMVAWHGSGARQKPPGRTVSSVLKGEVISGRMIMDHAYLGPSASKKEITSLIDEHAKVFAASRCTVEHVSGLDELCRRTANAIARGEVVGWFQGRMEWGPRALGNRSIVCDPRRADMKDILNSKIKRRESFRPFAPSVMQEHVADWFEEDGDVPFMMQVYQVREEKRSQIPAVTHVDGSGRLQTVYKETNERYWSLIDAFRSITGVPMVLNTSFNENEPIVCRPDEALNCYLRTQMDVLVIGDHFISRGNPTPE